MILMTREVKQTTDLLHKLIHHIQFKKIIRQTTRYRWNIAHQGTITMLYFITTIELVTQRLIAKKLFYDRRKQNDQQNRHQYNRPIARTPYISSFSEANNRKDTFTAKINNRFARSVRDTRCSTIEVRS